MTATKKSSRELRAGRTGRTVAAIFIVPVFAGVLAVSPADAATGGANGKICNGVVNQLAHRGKVQENLLKAAAKKNAEVIKALQAEKSALLDQAGTLESDIDALNAEIEELEAEEAQLLDDLASTEAELADLQQQRDAKDAEIQALQAAIEDLNAERNSVQDELAPLQDELADAQATSAEL